jgi:hypothetical protein
LKELHKAYGKQVDFLVVYIAEAHALDGERPMGGERGSPVVEEPETLEERKAVARRCDIALGLAPMTILIDDMQDTAGKAYAGHPDRLFLVGAKGHVSYAGARGPRGFNPDELEDAIRSELGLKPLKRQETRKRRR